MKKLFIFALTFLLVFSCSACKKIEDTFSSESVPTEKITQSDTSSLVSSVSTDIATEKTTTQSTATETESEVVSSADTPSSRTSSVTSTTSRATVSLPDYIGEKVGDTVSETTDVITNITTNIVPDIGLGDGSEDTTQTPMIATEDLFYFGTVVDNTYESSFLGIGCTLDSNWTLLTENEIKELNGIAVDATEAEITEQIEYAILLVDMVASTSTGDGNIIIMTVSDYGYGEFEALNIDEYLNSVAQTTKDIYTEAGYTDTIVERVTITIGEQQYYGLNTSVNISEVPLHQAMFCIKDGPYLTLVQITSSDSETLQQTLNSFYVVN